jgi:hypothetical protein
VDDVLARQLAQLLAGSDEAELREVVARWKSTAVTDAEKRHYADLGARLVELKAALATAPTPPTRAELETALALMMKLAREAPR